MRVREDVDDDGGPAAGAEPVGGAVGDPASVPAGGWLCVGGGGPADGEPGDPGVNVYVCEEPAVDPEVMAKLQLEFAVDEAAELSPSVLSAGALDGMAGVDAETLEYRQAVDLLEAAEKLVSASQALKARAVSRVCATAGDRVGEDGVRAAPSQLDRLASATADTEIGALLDLSKLGTDRLIHHSKSLTEDLPVTLEALGGGRINSGQAQVIIDQCGTLPGEALAEFEQQMVDFAPGRAKNLLADKGRRLRERTHPETIKRRKAKAAADRMVLLEAAEDGMSWLSAYLPAEAATGAYNRLTSVSRSLQGPDEGRNLSQLRADVFADLMHTGTGTGNPPAVLSGAANDITYGKHVTGKNSKDTQNGAGTATANASFDTNTGGAAAAGGAGGGAAAAGSVPGVGPVGSGRVPDYAGIKAEVSVVVPVLTLMGLSDEPPDLEGYGPIDEDTARRLAARAPSFKRILTHPETGARLSYGQNTYGVPADLKRLVKLRDGRCRAPGCNTPARFCELDHTVPYPAGGTDEWNLADLCKPIHMLKTAGLWRDIQYRDGTIDWTSPAGKQYTNTPEGPLPEMNTTRAKPRQKTETADDADESPPF